MNPVSLLVVGVGGQGTILVSKILTEGLVERGYDVKMSEIHGMSQRGGSVNTQIRYGEKINSPVIDKGQADCLVAFEEMEAYRWLSYLRPGGRVLVNNYRQPSAPIISGQVEYPEGLKDEIKSKAEMTVVEAAEMARELGMPRAMNIVMLGVIVKHLGMADESWPRLLANQVKPQFRDINLKAFERGLAA